jgi:hypothetical protein
VLSRDVAGTIVGPEVCADPSRKIVCPLFPREPLPILVGVEGVEVASVTERFGKYNR